MHVLFRRFSIIFSVILFIATTLGNKYPSTLLAATTAEAIVHRADQTAVSFSLYTPTATLDKAGRPHIAGLAQATEGTGAPALPAYSTLIAVPPKAAVSVTVTPQHTTIQAAGFIPPAIPATIASISDAAADVNVPLPASNEPNPAIYRANAYYPTTLHTVSDPMYYRDVRLVRLDLYPLRYNPTTEQLWQATELKVSVQFRGGQPASHQAEDPALAGLKTAVLNPEQLNQWRQLPDTVANATGTLLPTDRNSYKIEITADGIYQISYETLQTAGMNVDNINPHTFAMLHRGQPVAYQFIGDGDTQFEAGEAVRFFGWGFNGTRDESLYVDTNIFWLWADGTPLLVGNQSNHANQAGFPTTDQFRESRTLDGHSHYFSGWDINWDDSPNDPDIYYMDYIAHGEAGIQKSYTIQLPNAMPNGDDATYTIEISGRRRSNTNYNYEVRSHINNATTVAEFAWTGSKNFNLIDTVPASQLVAGDNELHLDFQASVTGSQNAEYFLNRITIDYTRQLLATDNLLVFGDEAGGKKTFHIDGFSEGDAANALIWNVSNPYQPQQITMEASHVAPTGNGFAYLVGSEHGENGRFIATTHNAIKHVSNGPAIPRLSQYQPTSLNPASNQADWLVITHTDFAAAAERLAQHRTQAAYGSHRTHIANIDDIINQYGYGLHHPDAIRNYLTYALGHWDVAPHYVLLIGDATFNPLHYQCVDGSPSCGGWDAGDRTFVTTVFSFVDRFQGQIISDHPLVQISGDDLIADMAIGRFSANTLAEANAAVDKTIWYEQQLNSEAAWQTNNLFVADNDDPNAGFFCDENHDTALHAPDSFNNIQICYNEEEIVGGVPSQAQTDDLRAQMLHYVKDVGVGLINYRGHGARDRWASPAILSNSSEHLNFWSNFGKPPVVLSADCLDGYFGWPGVPSLSETWLRLDQMRGSVAHWSATGLGFSFEHTVMHQGFYDALTLANETKIGDAILLAKLGYIEEGHHESEVYSFTLQGDPALQIFGSPTFTLSLPFIEKG